MPCLLMSRSCIVYAHLDDPHWLASASSHDMHLQMDAMIHFMAILFGAEVVARFIGDSAQPANCLLRCCMSPLCVSLEFITCRNGSLPLAGPRVYLKSTAELFDAAIVGISLASVFVSGIPNVNILRILR